MQGDLQTQNNQTDGRPLAAMPFIRRIKIALNRLGYYIPSHKTGITDEKDEHLQRAVKEFEDDHLVIASDGEINEGDTTHQRINNLAEQHAENSLVGTTYIWRTVGDGKVRSDHALRNGQKFTWDDPPPSGHPGKDYNCRCWAEPIGLIETPPTTPLPPRPPLRKTSPDAIEPFYPEAFLLALLPTGKLFSAWSKFLKAKKSKWILGSHKSATKWGNQMKKRNWTPDQITNTILKGKNTPHPTKSIKVIKRFDMSMMVDIL